ncbi:MAG: MFS transporter [Chitinivorax sp.]
MPTTASLTRRHEWILLLTLTVMNFTHIMDFMVMMPLGPQFMRLFHVTPRQFGLLVSTYTFAAAGVGFIAAFVVDRFDRKHTLLTVYAGFGVSTLLCALAPSYQWLLLARAVAGGFGGVMGATLMAIVGDVVPQERRGTAMGTVMAAFSLSAVAGVPSGLLLAEWFGWQGPFVFLGLLALPLWLLAQRILPPLHGHLVHRRSQNPWQQVRFMYSQPVHLRAFALMASLMFAGFSVIPFISPYMVANAGLGEADLKYIYLCGGLATLFSSRLIGWLADRVGKPQMFVAVALISLPAILTLTHWRPAPLPLTLLATTVFMVFVSGRLIPAMAIVTGAVEPQHRGSFMSFNSATQQLASGAASFCAGLLIHKNAAGQLAGYDLVGYAACGFTLLCIWLAPRIGSAPHQR